MADERITQKKVEPSDLPPNRAPLSTYLQYPTSTDTEEGWVVLAENGDGRQERTANLSVLKQIKNFLNSSSIPTPQEPAEPTRIDYPFYDADSESFSPPETQKEEIDDAKSHLSNDAETHTEPDAVFTEGINLKEVAPVVLEALPFDSEKSSPIDVKDKVQNSEGTASTETLELNAEERALDKTQETSLESEPTSSCVLDANEFVNFESIPPTPPVVEIVGKDSISEKTDRRQSEERIPQEAVLTEPLQDQRRSAFDSSVSEKMPIFKKYVDLLGSRNLTNREPYEESLPAPSWTEDNGVSVELVLPPSPFETESPNLFETSLILGCNDVQTF